MKNLVILTLVLLGLINTLNSRSITKSNVNNRENSFTAIKRSYKTVANRQAYEHRFDKAIVTTSYQTWGSQFKASLGECLLGIFLFVLSFPVLWLNERRAIETEEFIENGKQQCRSVECTKIDSENENWLVHVTGQTSVQANLVDNATSFVPLQSLIKLQRKVEMFAYVETSSSNNKEDNFGGGNTTTTTYSYSQQWCNNVNQNLKNPQYQNPSQSEFLVRDETWTQNKVYFGAFILADSQINQLNNFKTLELQDNQLIREQIGQLVKQRLNRQAQIYITRDYIYIKQNPALGVDTIGDQRISFSGVESGNISTIAQQVGNSFKPYYIGVTGNNRCCLEDDQSKGSKKVEKINSLDTFLWCICFIPKLACCCASCMCSTPTEMEYVYEGIQSSDDIFDEEYNKNSISTQCYRFLGWFCMYIGIYLFFSPCLSILKAIPLLSTLGQYVVTVFAVVISVPVTFIIIASSWILHRPVVSFLLLAISAGIIFYLYRDVFNYNNIQ